MKREQQKRISKRLSLHLRHEPETLGLTLEPGGWVKTDDLLRALSSKHFPITREQLETVVRENDKQRFSFDETGTKIRANQGHSTEVDLRLEPQIPPDVLYHGTATHVLETILKEGLKRMARHHVHLSTDKEMMLKVASRHGRPVLLKVSAKEMVESGHTFYLSANGVWLVDAVPAEFLEVVKEQKV
jgi:putative RNA 2'-phosphotransferase